MTALAAAGVYAASPYRVGITSGMSMEPTYHNGQPYLLERTNPDDALQRGQVVVFRRAGHTFMKRVLALPGDRFYVIRSTSGELDTDELIRDWELPKVRRMINSGRAACRIVRRVVPKECLYVLGDNTAVSEDSRSFGFVPRDSVIGTVIDAPLSLPREVRHLAWARDEARS